MVEERTEIQRLLDDTSKYGRRYVTNFNQVQNIPIGYQFQESQNLYQKIEFILKDVIPNQLEIGVK